MRIQLQEMLNERVQHCVSNKRDSVFFCEKVSRKKESLARRVAEMVKVDAVGKIYDRQDHDDWTVLQYEAHFHYLIRQKQQLYIEEEVEVRKAQFYKGELVDDTEIIPDNNVNKAPYSRNEEDEQDEDHERVSYRYDRLKAVQYAERWWNSYNPAFKKFDVDCTNYISQCLYAGKIPMSGYPNRSKGWWMRNQNWSYSWTVANSLRYHLSSSKLGLQAKEVGSADLLSLGDVICYDFQGDGRFDHNTIVTGKDAYGMPLVNAHTTNSRMRYWAYEDSSAYTPNIKYRFFTIVDQV